VKEYQQRTGFLGVDKEFVEFVSHSLDETLAVDLHLARVTNLRLADVYLER